MAMQGRKVYEFCPFPPSGVTSDCNVYDLDAHSWSSITSFPGTAAQAMVAAESSDSDHIFVGGGTSAGSATTVYTQWYRYSISGDSWTAMTSMPAGRAILGGALVREGDYIYVFGGWNGSGGTNTVFRYSISGDSWSTMTATLSSNRFALATALITTGEIMVMGGRVGSTNVKTVEVYDIANDSFSAGTDLPNSVDGLSGLSPFVVGNDLFFYGGFDTSGGGDAYKDELYKWDATDGWLLMNMRATSTGSTQGYSAPISIDHPSGTQTAVLCPGQFSGLSNDRSSETVEVYPAAGRVGVVGWGD